MTANATRARDENSAATLGYNLPVYRACQVIGSMTGAAFVVGVPVPTMSRYRRGEFGTPLRVAEALERATEGKVTVAEILRANKRIEAARLLDRAEQLLREAA